ncbi:MAG: chorismate synthase, partial [Slackia sp.]|nr:chorismate synthase [Slackia sp.]
IDIETSSCRCPAFQATRLMEIEMARARSKGETLGAEFELGIFGLAPGLGSPCREGAALSSRMAQAAFSIEGVCGVEFGRTDRSEMTGSDAHDDLLLDTNAGLSRATDVAGGIEGGLSTGMPLIMRVRMAASGRLGRDVVSVDMEAFEGAPYRAPVFSCCDAPAKSIVAESEAAFVLVRAYEEKFGSDSMDDIRATVSAYGNRLKRSAR